MNEQPLIIDTESAPIEQTTVSIQQPPPKQDPPGHGKPGTDCPPAVPEPGTLALIACGLIAAYLIGSSKK